MHKTSMLKQIPKPVGNFQQVVVPKRANVLALSFVVPEAVVGLFCAGLARCAISVLVEGKWALLAELSQSFVSGLVWPTLNCCSPALSCPVL
eukprot:503003-Amphidinium_carterae.1